MKPLMLQRATGCAQDGPARPIARRRGIALIDCLIYLVILVLIFGLTFVAFLETLRHSTELDRLAVTTVRALQAGEQWREDIRAARQTPQQMERNGGTELRLITATGEVGYAFRNHAVWRRATPTAPWLEVLDSVKLSRFTPDPRRHVTAWRWDLELIRRRETRQLRRVLTFQAVPPPSPRGIDAP
jgi:hypothetical protein